MRYVLFSDKYGVYLGRDQWSMKPPVNIPDAPTFPDDPLTKALVSLPNDAGVKLVPVSPDRPGHRASVEACANAMLPRWGEAAEPAERVAVKNIEPPPAGRRVKSKVGGTRVFDHKNGEGIADPEAAEDEADEDLDEVDRDNADEDEDEPEEEPKKPAGKR